MNSLPLISVIIPCYNQAQYLPGALDSILAQSYTNWECIIVNDGATDDTEGIAHQYVEKDKRFKYVFKTNGGLSTARNAGLKIATGQFIQFLDADDFLHPDKLRSSVNIINEYPECELVICNYKYYNATNTVHIAEDNINREFTVESIIMEWDSTFTIPIHCALIKTSVLSFFNESLKAKEDWLMWLDIFSKIKCFKFIDNAYAYYRLHDSSLTSKKNRIMEENTFLAYAVIYEKIQSAELRKLFFQKLINFSKNISQNKDEQITFLSNTYSYKIGHALLSPLKNFAKFTWTKKLIGRFVKTNYIRFVL
jgi:glycosyltransferase involved in cell wall biosynthesis